eukprot:GHUV01011974.1.p1 GENE.GHUV01011974.1~~GHUV01011974.1.p1  ORF type:complete len:190 (+),score=39.52 GHUV01011974.1:221-790(+)
MAPGPDRRAYEPADRHTPYARPPPALAATAGLPSTSEIDASTKAAIQAAAASAARAAIAQQQVHPVGGPHQPASVPVRPPGAPEFVKVSGESDPRKVAGKLAHTCREQSAPAMLTIGTKCINQAVKAICIARGEMIRAAPGDPGNGVANARRVQRFAWQLVSERLQQLLLDSTNASQVCSSWQQFLISD